MVSKGTSRPYIHLISNASTDVTGSMHLIRFAKYVMLLDCGMIQGMGDIMSNYKANREQLKKIKPNEIDWLILSHCHIDHSGLIPALFAKGCNAHVYVPMGSLPFLKLLWEDSMKINESDCLKLQNKHGIKAYPFYIQADIDKAISRCIEVECNKPQQLASNVSFTYYPAGHIIYANQVVVELREGSVIKRIGYTGDISGLTPRPYITPRQTLPFVNVLLGENTYNEQARVNNARDREKDLEKIQAVIRDSNKVLVPCFSLQRTQELLTVLYDEWNYEHLPEDIHIYLDSPLAQKFCNIWPDSQFWRTLMSWRNLTFVKEWTESVTLQMSHEKCIILSASGFLQGGRIMAHLKTALPDPHNHVLFVGYSGTNNLASQIKSGQKEVMIDGTLVKNKANITDLVSFSSHASYEELMAYYQECRYDKLALVHGSYETKVSFAHTLQDKLSSQGKSSRVICTQADQKIYL